ncbi:hypothetical protein [Phormidesmis priestleyi]
MVSKWWIALVGVTIFSTQVLHSNQVVARSCANNCPPPALQFTPGQKIRVQVINRAENPVQIEKVFRTNPALLNQGQQIEFERGGSTDPNLSIIFWDVTSLALKSRVSKPKPDLLLIELQSEKRYPPGDRSIYIRNDGRVEVF